MELRKSISILMVLATALCSAMAQTDYIPPADGGADGTTLTSATEAAVSLPTEAGAGSILGLSGSGTASGADPGFLLGGVSASESAERDPSRNSNEGSSVFSVAHVFGQLQLLKFRRTSETAFAYVGGGAFYSGQSADQQLHRLVVGQRFLWPRVQLTLGNSFGDLPGGNFGSSLFGGFLASQLGFPADTGVSDSFGSSEFGELSQTSHITNASVAEVSRALTARSSANVAVGYALTTYFDNPENLINSRQVSARAGYTYQLSRRDQIGVLYAYRLFRFPQSSAGEIGTNLIQVTFARQLSSRMSLALGGGPEIVSFSDPSDAGTRQINASGYASWAYRLRKSTLALSYDRQVTRGSGLFAGGQSDIVRLFVARPLGRGWSSTLDAGYVGSRRLESSLSRILGRSYRYGFAGASIQRRLGFNATVFARYEFNDESFDRSSCAVSGSCGLQGIRHAVAIGLNWQIRPIRLE